MRQYTYERIESLYEKYCGYIVTKDLLSEGFTNRQISLFQQEGYLEKIANGYFWMPRAGMEKPYDYKAIEVGLVNNEAIIIADSACFYQGLINVEPSKVSIATRRGDRHKMVVPFEVTRHYLAESGYEEGKKKIETQFGDYNVYEIGRSVYDCIRFRESIDGDIFDFIIENYKKEEEDRKAKERLLTYARKMKFEDKVKKIL